MKLRCQIKRVCIVLACLFSMAMKLNGQSTDANQASTISAEDREFFESKIRPLLVEHCYECHSGKESHGGLKLDTRDSWMEGGDTGPAIVPSQPEESLLVEAIRYSNQHLQMPPDGKLTAEKIRWIEEWVRKGAADPRIDPVDSSKSKLIGMSVPDGRQFWSFQPVRNPEIPAVKNHPSIQSPIDVFILSRLDQEQLTQTRRISKSALLRRVTFDLIGLPPTPEELSAFLNDTSGEAYDRVIERLLASPHYGERWGRHWLDVARYADSNGLDENLAFGNAWRYRDYVVRSFNEDKPYDQFLVEQLAGDLIENANEDSITATGFLVLGAKVLAEPDREKLAMDTIDEQIDSTGKALLGMTLGCVRCHDHKFDPIKQTDYYALAAIFKSTQTFASTKTGAIQHWNEVPIGKSLDTDYFKELEKQIKELAGKASTFKSEAISKIRSDARESASKYLAAASEFGDDASLGEVEVVAGRYHLHPRILLNCRKHLEVSRDDPFFATWHSLVQERKSSEEIEHFFNNLFDQVKLQKSKAETVTKAESEKGKKVDATESPNVDSEKADLVKLAEKALSDSSGFLAIPAQPEFAFDAETFREYDRLMEEARVFESQAPDEPTTMSVGDGKLTESIPIHIRGNHRNLGKLVSRGFPEVMRQEGEAGQIVSNQSGRLELAKWIASRQHPLTTRVMVNRIWRWHFGRGLVASTDNFGVLGDKPSHPELLDWLATQFVNSGWSIKELHRLIVRSQTYQIGTQASPEMVSILRRSFEIDPENKLHWQFPPMRLEAEQIRDSILYVAGQLDETIAGKTVPLRNRQFVFNHTSVDHTRYDSLRRALYLPVIRNNVYTLFEQFNFPDPTTPTGDRQSTTVAPQALLLMNDDLVLNASEAFAKRLLKHSPSIKSRIDYAYQLAYSRVATPTELETATLFLSGMNNSDRAWQLFCQSIFASNEFIYVE